MRQVNKMFINIGIKASLALLFLLLLVGASLRSVASGVALASLPTQGGSARVADPYGRWTMDDGRLLPSSIVNAPAPPLDTPTSTPTACVPSWNVVSSPNVGTGNNDLKSVAIISANNIWAVGQY